MPINFGPFTISQTRVRKQACDGLQRLCLGRTRQDKKVTTFLGPVLEQLLTFLSDHELFKPKKGEMELSYLREEKEIYGPSCNDYFLFIRLCLEELDSNQTDINMDALLKQVTDDVLNRPFYETHKGYEEDEGLLGLLNVASAIYRHKPPFNLQEDNTVSIRALSSLLLLTKKVVLPQLRI